MITMIKTHRLRKRLVRLDALLDDVQNDIDRSRMFHQNNQSVQLWNDRRQTATDTARKELHEQMCVVMRHDAR